jgi:hypothetical protein
MQASRLVEILVNDMRASFLDQEARGRRPRAGAGAVNAGIGRYRKSSARGPERLEKPSPTRSLSFQPLKRYGPWSAVNGDGCREAIGSTIATDDATRRTSPTSTGIRGDRFDVAVGGRPLGIAVAQDCPWPRLWRYP